MAIVTVDPWVVIDEQREGFTLYRSLSDGRRWTVEGVCDYRGDCMVGAVEPWTPMCRANRLDVPVAPGFTGCCPLVITELDA